MPAGSRSSMGIDIMQPDFCPSTLVPRGLLVGEAMLDGAGARISVRAVVKASVYPDCGTPSQRVHSQYRRRLADLPIAGRPVCLMVLARKFYCNAVLCGRRVFTERFETDVLAPWARRTSRLDHIVHHLGLALGGRPAVSFARRLMLPVSKDTLLRVVRRRGGVRCIHSVTTVLRYLSPVDSVDAWERTAMRQPLWLPQLARQASE